MHSSATPQSPISAKTQDPWHADISWLTDGLAVSGCFPMEHAPAMARELRVRAIIDLREEDRDDAAALGAAGIDFLHLPTPDLMPVTVDMLDQGVDFARSYLASGERVLIHCQHGIGRSPLLALCVMVADGHDPLDALERAKDRRALVSPSPDQFNGWVAWLTAHGHQPPTFEAFCTIAYRHLAQQQ